MNLFLKSIFFLTLYFGSVFKLNGQDTVSVDSMIDVAWDYRYTRRNEAKDLLLVALNNSKKINYKRGEATCYNILGIIERDNNFYTESINYFSKALLIRKQISDSIGVGNVLNNMGTVKRLTAEYNEGLGLLLEALDIFEEHKNRPGIAMCSDNLANLFDDQGQYYTAITYNKQSLTISLESKDSFAIARSKVNLSERYLNLDSTEMAISLCLDAISIFKELNDWEGEAIAKMQLADIFFELGEFDKSKSQFLESANLYLVNNDYGAGLMYVYWGLANLYTSINNPSSALEYLTKAERLHMAGESIENERYIKLQKSLVYFKMERFDSAYHYLKKGSVLNDSIFNIEKSRQFAEMQTKYETEKTERELAEQKLVSQKNQFQKNIFIGLFLAAFILASFSYFYFTQKQKAARTISQQNQKIHQQEIQEILKNQELTAINSMLEGQENERIRIAKDLHDRLGSMLTTVKWNFDAFIEKQTPEQGADPLIKASGMLDDAYQEVRRIAHNMVSGVLTKFGLVPALQELARTISSGGKLQVKVMSSGLGDRLENKVEITLYRVVQELLSNILKHANATESIIQLTRLNGELNISVEDNGKGFDPEKIKYGMGIKNIEARIQALDGSFFIDSGKGNGTTVMIDLPV